MRIPNPAPILSDTRVSRSRREKHREKEDNVNEKPVPLWLSGKEERSVGVKLTTRGGAGVQPCTLAGLPHGLAASPTPVGQCSDSLLNILNASTVSSKRGCGSHVRFPVLVFILWEQHPRFALGEVCFPGGMQPGRGTCPSRHLGLLHSRADHMGALGSATSALCCPL